MAEVFKMTLPGSPDHIKIAKTAMGTVAAMHGLDIESTHDMQVAVAEACRLVTCHGFSGWSRAYDVTCETDDEKLIVRVEDKEMSHQRPKDDEQRCLCCPSEGDMAVKLLEHVMDKVEINKAGPGCKSIIMSKNLK